MHGVAPQMCDGIASPLSDRGAGGRSPGYPLPLVRPDCKCAQRLRPRGIVDRTGPQLSAKSFHKRNVQAAQQATPANTILASGGAVSKSLLSTTINTIAMIAAVIRRMMVLHADSDTAKHAKQSPAKERSSFRRSIKFLWAPVACHSW